MRLLPRRPGGVPGGRWFVRFGGRSVGGRRSLLVVFMVVVMVGMAVSLVAPGRGAPGFGAGVDAGRPLWAAGDFVRAPWYRPHSLRPGSCPGDDSRPSSVLVRNGVDAQAGSLRGVGFVLVEAGDSSEP